MTTPGLLHTVYFWLVPGLTSADREAFVAGAKALGDAPTVLTSYVGRPGATPERDVTDHSFDYSLHLYFADAATHDAYQTDPVHLKFVEEQAAKFAVVKVYDTGVV